MNTHPETPAHPLTETAAALLWNQHRDTNSLPFHKQGRLYMRSQTAMLRAAFDAGRDPVQHLLAAAEPLARTLLGVPAGHGAPHHDVKEIKAEDYVLQVDRDGFIRAGKAHCQAADGDWHDENGGIVTWAALRADRPDALTVWPAPTPPADEVEWEPQFGGIITDVEVSYGEVVRFDRMVWTGRRWTYQDHSTVPKFITAFTLPDGTRVRRDGKHEDNTPRFVKAGEGEK